MRLRYGAVSALILIALWSVAAYVAADESLLPPPLAVAETFLKELRSGELWFHLSATLIRVVAAFAVAMAVGCFLGVWSGRNKVVNAWLDPWLIVFLNLPALVVIVLCHLWIGLTEAAAITAVALNKIPMITSMMREGARALDPALDDMALAYRMRPMTRWRHVVAPQLAPYFAAAARNGIALIWKIVLVVEFLGRSNGIGFQIHLYFQLFEVGHILAFAGSFIMVMLLVEYSVLQPWERSASKWRLNAA